MATMDLAAGPGGAGIAAARRVGPTGSVVLSDVSPEMMAVAASRARADSRVSTAVFEQNTIPLEAASFDVIIKAERRVRGGDGYAHAGSLAG